MESLGKILKNIIRENGFRIRQIIKNITGSYNEDIEQEVYIKTCRSLDKYTEQNKFVQWISTIASNCAKDYLRSSYFKISKKIEPEDENINLIKETKTPEAIYSLKERQKFVLRAVNSLPKKMKEAIILYEFEDYSYEKISKKLKIPEGTVKSRINSARKILKEKLEFLISEEK